MEFEEVTLKIVPLDNLTKTIFETKRRCNCANNSFVHKTNCRFGTDSCAFPETHINETANKEWCVFVDDDCHEIDRVDETCSNDATRDVTSNDVDVEDGRENDKCAKHVRRVSKQNTQYSEERSSAFLDEYQQQIDKCLTKKKKKHNLLSKRKFKRKTEQYATKHVLTKRCLKRRLAQKTESNKKYIRKRMNSAHNLKRKETLTANQPNVILKKKCDSKKPQCQNVTIRSTHLQENAGSTQITLPQQKDKCVLTTDKPQSRRHPCATQFGTTLNVTECRNILCTTEDTANILLIGTCKERPLAFARSRKRKGSEEESVSHKNTKLSVDAERTLSDPVPLTSKDVNGL